MPSFYVTYKSKFIKIKTSQAKEIVGTVYQFDHPSLCTREQKFTFSCKQKVEILSVRNVQESLTGEAVPCVLVKLDKLDKYTLYLFAISSDISKFIPIRKVEVSDSAINSQLFYILDGPALLSIVDSAKFVIYVSDSANMCQLRQQCYKLPVDASVAPCDCLVNSCIKNIPNDNNVSKCEQISRLLHASYVDNEYLLFLQQPFTCICFPNRKVPKALFIVLQYSCISGFTIVNSANFLPGEYQPPLTSLYNVSLQKKFKDTYKAVHKTITGTKDGYILELENGRLSKCLSLSSDAFIPAPVSVNEIHFPSGSLYDGKSSFMVLQDNNAVAVNTEFKILKKWPGISKVFCGYFIYGESVQYLLFRGKSLHDGWILTDLDAIEIHSDGAVSDKDDLDTKYSDSVGSAVHALQARLQGEQLLLYEKEQECRRTEAFVRSVFTGQQQLQEGSAQCKIREKSGLLPLIEGPSQNPHFASTQQDTEEESVVDVTDLWQRTYCDKWVIGVSFRNRSDSDLLVSVTVVPSDVRGFPNTLTCHSVQHVSKSQKLSESDESENLRIKPKHPRIEDTCNFNKFVSNTKTDASHSEAETVTCKTDVPNFSASDVYSVQIFIKWSRRSAIDSNRQRGCTLTNKDGVERRERIHRQTDGLVTYSKCCGELILKSEDIILGKYELNVFSYADLNDIDMQDIKDAKQDMVAMGTVQQTTLLEVRSSPSILTSLDQLLMDRCNFIYNHRLSCYVTKIQPLAKVQIQLDTYSGGDRRYIKTYTSCDKELFLLVHHLYACLPDHVIILLQEPSAGEVTQSCLPSLQRELHFLSHGVRNLLEKSDSKADSSDECVEAEEDIRKVGEKFKRKREKLMEKTKKEVNSDRLNELCERLMKLTQETDSAIANFNSNL